MMVLVVVVTCGALYRVPRTATTAVLYCGSPRQLRARPTKSVLHPLPNIPGTWAKQFVKILMGAALQRRGEGRSGTEGREKGHIE